MTVLHNLPLTDELLLPQRKTPPLSNQHCLFMHCSPSILKILPYALIKSNPCQVRAAIVPTSPPCPTESETHPYLQEHQTGPRPVISIDQTEGRSWFESRVTCHRAQNLSRGNYSIYPTLSRQLLGCSTGPQPRGSVRNQGTSEILDSCHFSSG